MVKNMSVTNESATLLVDFRCWLQKNEIFFTDSYEENPLHTPIDGNRLITSFLKSRSTTPLPSIYKKTLIKYFDDSVFYKKKKGGPL